MPTNPELEDDCACECPRCQLREAIFSLATERVDGEGVVCPATLAVNLIPTLGEILAFLPYEGCEGWWKAVINARALAMTADADRMPPAQGRA